MSVFLSLPVLFSQITLPGIPERWRAIVLWLLVFGEPSFTTPGLIGGLITWLKVVSLFCLLGWVVAWVATALKERTVARGNWLDIAALAGVVIGIAAMVLRVMESSTREATVYKLGGVPVVPILALACGVAALLWVEVALWMTIVRRGRALDVALLVGIHLALILGLGVGLQIQQWSLNAPKAPDQTNWTWQDGLISGARLSATYMGYVVLLRVTLMVLRELISVRFRRLYAIAKLSVIEANRRMWAPWVVITVFLVVLAFTHWFLQPPRPAEMGRLFVGTLSLLCSLLLTAMVTILTPLSLPNDIQQQTIYTVVSKPVRRIELIWGRILGFMAIVTALVAVFGLISLLYLSRTVGGTIRQTEDLARKELQANRTTQANHLFEEAAQIRARMSARKPIRGSLTFLDSRGNFHIKGIDVGQEQSMREPRSHIEGATPAAAIWQFGVVRNPYQPDRLIDRRIPLDGLIAQDTIEGWNNQALELKSRIAAGERAQADPNLPSEKAQKLAASVARDKEELQNAESAANRLVAQAKDEETQAKTADAAGRGTEAETIRRRVAALHSPPIELQMTFNVYRTTKGRIGDPVYAEIEVTNPFRPDLKPYRNIFAIREYYTNRQYVPATYLAGSKGALKVEIRCISPTQYLGMAESDLYILASKGDFGTNYMKGLFGVWLQAMVLTAIGVFAGTFLSWPVALLTTIAFFVAGQVAFSFLLDFTRQSLLGGGPFESLVRLLAHDNQMSELAPTMAVVTAKTFDAIVMPVMSLLVYIVPNFTALDVSNTVADGFEVRWSLLLSNLLLALAYVLPFSIAGYFILKNREVAA